MLIKSYIAESNIEVLNKNLNLFYGENLGLKNDFRKKIKLKFKDAEIIYFNQEEILKNNEIIMREINNISLFDKKKIFFIDLVNDKFTDIAKKIFEINKDEKIFLFAEILEKRSKLRSFFENSKEVSIIPCYADNEITIKKIINERLKGFNGLTRENVNIISENSNMDRIKLNNEIDKIITYFQDKKIDEKELEILLDLKINDDFNLLKDEALKGNIHNTNKLLSETMLEEEKNVYYLSLINIRLNKIKELKKLSLNKNIEAAISDIKPPIFWKEKDDFLSQVKKWDSQKISKILQRTYDLEVKIKSNSLINKNSLMKKLIVDLCTLANS